MILGLIAWSSIGLLLVLFGVLRAMPCSARLAFRTRFRDRMPPILTGSSGNSVFDEHRASVLRRREKERQARDRAAFKRFMQMREARL